MVSCHSGAVTHSSSGAAVRARTCIEQVNSVTPASPIRSESPIRLGQFDWDGVFTWCDFNQAVTLWLIIWLHMIPASLIETASHTSLHRFLSIFSESVAVTCGEVMRHWGKSVSKWQILTVLVANRAAGITGTLFISRTTATKRTCNLHSKHHTLINVALDAQGVISRPI